jgi:hypothetical protein
VAFGAAFHQRDATSTLAIWPGTVGTIWGYRTELRTSNARVALAAPSVVGCILGAVLLNHTQSAVFDALVPFLILLATLLFMVQELVQNRLEISDPELHKSMRWLIGAGIGILMLAAQRANYFSSAIIPGTLHCCCKLPGAHLYSVSMTFAISSWLLPSCTKPVTRLRSFSTLLR